MPETFYVLSGTNVSIYADLFSLEEIIMGLKPPLSYENQIEQLKKNGIEISDHETALSILSETNYYRLSGYTLQFRNEPQKSHYQAGTSFEKIYNL